MRISRASIHCAFAANVALLSLVHTSDGFAFHLPKVIEIPDNPEQPLIFEPPIPQLPQAKNGGGGRVSGCIDMPSLENWAYRWEPSAQEPSEAKLTIIQITDVYTLENFASLKTLLDETREKCEPGSVISMLTGDFLSPYLLSSIDRGYGMMNALAKTPIDYLTWGNHEADIDHRTVCKHVRGFPGTWLNSNMQDHAEMDHQKPFDIVEVCSPDGTNTRRIGLVAVLSNDPDLYSHFKAPGAFGGATITDPWECLKEYKELLEGPEYNCDVVIPLQHLYVPDDHITCKKFDFPVILSGHDHHTVDEIIDGSRLIKPGMNGVYATALELTWEDDKAKKRPDISATFVETKQWQSDPVLEAENERAYDALAPLRNTELANVPEVFQPLTSLDSRGSLCSMGQYICTLLRSSMNKGRRQRGFGVDAVMLMGGNIRGATDYPEDSYFSLEALEAEVKSDETVAVVPMPGWLIEKAIVETHGGEPIPGWMQFDIGIVEEKTKRKHRVTHIAGEPIDRDQLYRVVTKVPDLTNGQSPSLTEFFTENPEFLPPKGAYVNIHAELMAFFARNLWRKLWEAASPTQDNVEDLLEFKDDDIVFSPPLDILCESLEECSPEKRLSALDRDGDGLVSVEDIHFALRDLLGLSIHEEEMTLANFVHNFADTSGDGQVTIEDFQVFCQEMPLIYEHEKWRLASAEEILLKENKKEKEIKKSTQDEKTIVVTS